MGLDSTPTFLCSANLPEDLAHQLCSCSLFPEDVAEAGMEYYSVGHVKHVFCNPCRHCIMIMFDYQLVPSNCPADSHEHAEKRR